MSRRSKGALLPPVSASHPRRADVYLRMIQLKDTVVLEDVTCEAWGCQRSNLQFWREIWLKRVES